MPIFRSKKDKEKRDVAGVRVEHRETLYSSDFGVPVSSSPPRREWEHISLIEEKIDRLHKEVKRDKGIERKIDRLLSRKRK